MRVVLMIYFAGLFLKFVDPEMGYRNGLVWVLTGTNTVAVWTHPPLAVRVQTETGATAEQFDQAMMISLERRIGEFKAELAEATSVCDSELLMDRPRDNVLAHCRDDMAIARARMEQVESFKTLEKRDEWYAYYLINAERDRAAALARLPRWMYLLTLPLVFYFVFGLPEQRVRSV